MKTTKIPQSALAFGIALLALSATQCAAQTAQTPQTRAPLQDSAFASVAGQVRNPCADSGNASLLGVLQSGQTCFEASVLSDDIVFFLSQGLSAEQTVRMMVSEYASIVAPHAFRTANRPRLGDETAPVEVVIFSDFQCPYCARAAQTMHKIAENHAGDASIVFKQMPLVRIHPYAAAAAVVTAFAHEKGQFWTAHDDIFAHQSAISADYLSKLLETLGAAPEDVFDPVKGQPYGVVVIEDMADAEKADVGGTPSVFIDGVFVQGGANYDRVSARIQAVRYAQQAGLARAHAPETSETAAHAESGSEENAGEAPNAAQTPPDAQTPAPADAPDI